VDVYWTWSSKFSFRFVLSSTNHKFHYKPTVSHSITVKPDVLFRELCGLLPEHWCFDCQLARSNLRPPRTTCSLQLRIWVVSLENCAAISMANSFLNWNFNLEYYPAGEIRVLSCERQCGANLFLKATTTNFNKQNSKLKPQHSFIVYKSNFITTANLIAFHWLK